MKDDLGNRMKEFYENRFRIELPRRTYTLIRVDGKAFHTFTKGLERPFDAGLMDDMNSTAAYLCKNIQGAKFAYVQSDEISILVTDFDTLATDAWFDGNLQKMASVSASIATASFNLSRMKRFCLETSSEGMIDHDDLEKFKVAMFDSRIFQISSGMEVENYFIWRQQDATRNSISSAAQSVYPHRELEKKTSEEKQEMLFQKGINWNDYSSREKRGGFIERVDFINGKRIDEVSNDEINIDDVVRKKWTTVECPIFTQDRGFLRKRIPILHAI